jgi:polyhydroxyalkanoate synthesis regulator phasin
MEKVELLDRIILAGLGAWVMTRQEAADIYSEIRKNTEEDFVNQLIDRSKKMRKNLEKVISEQITNLAKSVDVASREDVRRLEKRMAKLEKSQAPKTQRSKARIHKV